MSTKSSFFAELRQRHVVRAAIIYAAAVWALAQGIAQLSPTFGVAPMVTWWFVIACAIGFPFWLAFAWYFKFTSRGIEREGEVEEDTATIRRTGRKLDYWIIGIMAVAIVLLLTNQLVLQRGKTMREFTATITPSSVTAIPAKSVAVLPFVNESGNRDQQYFSDGLSEDLITALSQFAGLKVINRDSSFRFRNSTDSVAAIASQLGVAHLLEGSVQRAGDEVRISAELINAAEGTTLWSQHYDRPYKDLFALQDVITKAVAGALKAKLLPVDGAVVQSDRPPSGNLAAYNAYLRGQFYFQRGTEVGTRQAIAQFAEAIRLDPDYALAYALESAAWASMAGTFLTDADGISHAYAEARAAVDTALRLNPDLAAAHRARGGVMVSVDFDWSGALAEARRTAELEPGSVDAKSALAQVEARLGQVQAAVELQQQALVSAPLDGIGYFVLGRILNGLGRLDEAEAALRKAIKLTPGASRPYTYLAMVKIQQGDATGALAAAEHEPAGFWHDFAVTLALQAGSDRTAADAALKNLIVKYAAGASYQIAEVYALRRDPDNMLKWLEQARINRDAGIELMLFDPLILRYRNDPRFAAFCKKVGLPTTTDAVAMK